MLGFTLGTADDIKLVIDERTAMSSLIDSSEIYGYEKLDGSLD